MPYIYSMEKEKSFKATFRLSERQWRTFRSYCVMEGRQTSDVLRELINRYIMAKEGREPVKK